ncbi:anti-sigma factor [Flavobacterium marginilacus]|uniref:anti-sigma factor n=1 Tax=Flavobacterium marginilacus TaxID=3003256 RepID=UPI00248DC0D7|nr:anti-sigma factor [Flavobacterium marginilacus]
MKMNNENEKLDQLFENFDNQWDVHELDSQHSDRFSKKLALKKKKRNYSFIYAVAASVVVLLGVSLLYRNNDRSKELKFASKETKQTDSIFTVLIKNELEKIHEKKSPENEKIISDALKQMKLLDSDYDKIMHELEVNGESKPIIYAMISNLQTRISFLQSVLQRIEESEKLKNLNDEKTI